MTEIDDELWAAIGDPTRRRVLDLLLAGGPGTASGLSRQLPVTRQAVAKHLAVLERAGLVSPEPTGREVRYDVDEKPGVSNLLTILSALTDTPIDVLVQQFAGRGYGDLKNAVAEAVAEFATPYRNRTLELLQERGELESILAKGADRAREVASATLADVYDKVGLV